MNKEECVERILNSGIIAVVRTDDAKKALAIAEAIKAGGIDAIEITMTVPNALEVLKELTNIYKNNEVIIGAGTILDAETARAAILAGAEYIISPHFNPEVIKMCNRYRKLAIPGVMTITEIVNAMEAGADFVKLFPGSALGPSFVKAVKGPLPQARIIPTGGVSLDNVETWFKNGSAAVAVGGELTAGAKQNDYKQITSTAIQFANKIKEAKRQ